jgi:GTPase SAR1 family protein
MTTCVVSGDAIDDSKCLAQVRDVFPGGSCIFRQCREYPLAKSKFGRLHQGKNVLVYTPNSNVLEASKIDYIGSNKAYRADLNDLNILASNLQRTIVSKRNDLQGEFNIVVFEIDRVLQNTAAVESQLEELQSTYKEVLEEQGEEQSSLIAPLESEINDLKIQLKNLNKQNALLTQRLEGVEKDSEQCEVHYRDLTVETITKLKSLLTSLEQTTSSEPPIFLEPEQKTNLEALLEAKREERVERIKKQPHGLFTLVRIKCADPDPSSAIELKIQGDLTGEQFIFQIDSDRVVIEKDKNPTLTVLDDNHTCTPNRIASESESKINKTFKELGNVRPRGGDGSKLRELQLLISAGIIAIKNYWEEEKQNIALQIEYGLMKKQKNYGEAWEKLRSQDVTARFFENVKPEETLYKPMTLIESEIGIWLKNHETLLRSGKQFIASSTITFLKEYPKLLDAITIVSMGGSGSGKTTVSKALLSNVITSIIDNPNFESFLPNATISIGFREIYQTEQGTIAIRNLSTTNPLNASNPEYFLIQPEPIDNRENWIVLCGSEEKKQDCAVLKSRGQSTDLSFSILKQLKALDEITERNRRTRYTLHNKSGSSRSIKIIQIRFELNGKIMDVNLVDTAGYEDYRNIENDEKKELTNYYIEKIKNVALESPPFRSTLASKSRSSSGIGPEMLRRNVSTILTEGELKAVNVLAKDLTQKTLQEGNFIRNSLVYLETLIQKYAKIQSATHRSIKPSQMNDMEFKANLDRIKQLDSQIGRGWMTNLNGTNLVPQNSTLILLLTLKKTMSPSEVDSGVKTLDVLKTVMR